MTERKVYSVIKGQIIPIEQVEDLVFAEKMLGDGIAIRPNIEKSAIEAPCDGIIKTLSDSMHAFALETSEGIEILVHIGVDTVLLKGEGFKSFVKVGQEVKKGDQIIEVDFAAILNKVPSIDVIVVTTNLPESMKLVKTTKSNTIAGDHLFFVVDKESDIALEEGKKSEDGFLAEIVSPVCEIMNEAGVHARPASMIFQLANKHKAKVELKKGDKIANAKSIVAILGLGIKYREKVFVIASGEGAKEAIDSIVKAINSGLGEPVVPSSGASKVTGSSSDEKKASNEEIITDFSKEVVLKGRVASPSLVIGKSFLVEEEEIGVQENGEGIDFETKKLEKAIESVNAKLQADINEALEQKQNTKVEVFKAHLNILKDISILEEADKNIKLGKSAEFAWKVAIKNSIDILYSTKDKLLIERVADFKDITRRVVKDILGIEDNTQNYPEKAIIIAKDLVPSDIINFGEKALGVLLALGSSTSHVSLMLRNMGVPTLVALGESILHVANNVDIVVDANDGFAIINPDSAKLEEIKIKAEKLNAIKVQNIANCKLPAKTKDGINILVKGNVSNAKEAHKAFDLGGEGIGLLRTEFLFFNSLTAPTEDEQNLLYQEAVDAMQGGSVTFRTLDVGGDKPLAYIDIGYEENPILGLRGVRNYTSNKQIFLDQIRAILRIKPVMLSKIMIPMVANIDEIKEIRQIVEEEKNKLGIRDKIQIGTMIEVPSAALIAEQMSKHVDFFSIGTNDLAQYTLAMDRGNPKLTAKLNNLHPALLKLIKMTVDGGNANNVPTAVCGAMASEIRSIPILIGLGIVELSTSMKSIPDVKALIREISYDKCKEVASKALKLESAEEVEKLINQEFNL